MLAAPDVGDVISVSSGCRKFRWRAPERGKRGGYRVIYFLRNAPGQIVLLLLYAKNVRQIVEPELPRELKERFRP